MKSLLTLTTLALAASPLSAIILDVPFVYSTNLVTGASIDSVNATPVYFSNGLGYVANGEGPAVYTAFTFTPTVTSTGPGTEYNFSSQWTSGVDGFLALYANSYDPNFPLTNLLIANNNTGVPIEQSSFLIPLTAGLTYVLVNTLNDPSNQGPLIGANRVVQGNIGGPGSIDTPGFPPPEGIPFGVDSTLGLVVLGAVGALRLRRNRKA